MDSDFSFPEADFIDRVLDLIARRVIVKGILQPGDRATDGMGSIHPVYPGY